MRRNSLNGVNGPGFEVQSSPIVLINALGFVGFKLIGVAGSREVRISLTPSRYNLSLSAGVFVESGA